MFTVNSVFKSYLSTITLLPSLDLVLLTEPGMTETDQSPEVDQAPEEEVDQEPGYRAAQLLSSIDGGDLLPEADIVSNIIDKLER